MPTSAEILEGLRRVAREARLVAITWHVLVGLAVAAWAVGWRPSRRAAALLLVLLPVSVAAAAWPSEIRSTGRSSPD